MAEEYIPLALLKQQITMKPGVADRDDLLQLALDTAHEDVNEYCGRRFDLDPAPSARLFDVDGRVVPGASGEKLLVDDIGDTTGLLVETGWASSWSTTPPADYLFDPPNAFTQMPKRPITGLLLAGGYWPPSPLSRVRVTARWGWPAVPSKVKEATLIQATRLYARRNSPEGVLGSADWGAIRVARIDPDVEALLGAFTLAGFN